jgi:hypothetical protein
VRTERKPLEKSSIRGFVHFSSFVFIPKVNKTVALFCLYLLWIWLFHPLILAHMVSLSVSLSLSFFSPTPNPSLAVVGMLGWGQDIQLSKWTAISVGRETGKQGQSPPDACCNQCIDFYAMRNVSLLRFIYMSDFRVRFRIKLVHFREQKFIVGLVNPAGLM